MGFDKRLLYIRNMEALSEEQVTSLEFQVLTNSRCSGWYKYGPYELLLWEMTEKPLGEERTLCLRIKQKQHLGGGPDWNHADKKNPDHGGGPASELVALASLFLRRKVSLGPGMRRDDTPVIVTRPKPVIDHELLEGTANLGDLVDWFPLVEKLSPDKQQSFMLAAKLYHQALERIESQPDLAYLNLVSAIEALANDYKILPLPLSEFDPKMAELVDEIGSPELQRKISEHYWSRQHLISRRFKAFIKDHLKPDFWTHGGRPTNGRVQQNDLPKILERIYKQRSDTLHGGSPYPPYVFDSPFLGGEIQIGDMTVGAKLYPAADAIPYPFFFERLVNHVLKNFLRNAAGAP